MCPSAVFKRAANEGNPEKSEAMRADDPDKSDPIKKTLNPERSQRNGKK